MDEPAGPQRADGFRRFRSDVDQRQRFFADEINIDIADVKRRWNGKRNDFHICDFRFARFAIYVKFIFFFSDNRL